MTVLLHQVLAETLAASSLAQEAILLTVAHGKVMTRGTFVRREVISQYESGVIPMLNADSILMIPEAAAPASERDDVVHVDGRLWHVRSALDDGAGSLKLQLQEAQTVKASVAGMAISVVIVGDPAREGELLVLATAGALRPGDEVSLNRDAFAAGAPQPWTAGYAATVLTPA